MLSIYVTMTLTKALATFTKQQIRSFMLLPIQREFGFAIYSKTLNLHYISFESQFSICNRLTKTSFPWVQ